MNFLENLNIKTELTSEKFLDIYKTTLETKNLPFKSFGKGFSLDEAKNSAYGEMCERILTRNFLEEYYKYYIKAESAEIMEKFLRILLLLLQIIYQIWRVAKELG